MEENISQPEPFQEKKRRKKQKKEAWEIVLKDRFLTNEKKENPYVVALLYFFVFFMSFLLIFVCFFQLCEVRRQSMMNTLNNGDHVLLLKEGSKFDRGDIVVITKDVENNGKTEKTNIIKRIIGVAGDTLRFTIDRESGEDIVLLYIKKRGDSEFRLQTEDYIKEPMKKGHGFKSDFAYNTDIEVPEDHIYVMGDNRNNSEDSRGADGPYPVKSVYGKSVMRIEKGSLLEFFLKFLYRDNSGLN